MTNQLYVPFVARVGHLSLLLLIEPEVRKKGNWTMVLGILWYMQVKPAPGNGPQSLKPIACRTLVRKYRPVLWSNRTHPRPRFNLNIELELNGLCGALTAQLQADRLSDFAPSLRWNLSRFPGKHVEFEHRPAALQTLSNNNWRLSWQAKRRPS
jgi:hypothetical protein